MFFRSNLTSGRIIPNGINVASFHTPNSCDISASTLRNMSVSCIGLLRFSLFEAVEKSVENSIRAIFFVANLWYVPMDTVPKAGIKE